MDRGSGRRTPDRSPDLLPFDGGAEDLTMTVLAVLAPMAVLPLLLALQRFESATLGDLERSDRG